MSRTFFSNHDNRSIVANSPEITIERAGDECWVSRNQSRIATQLPLRTEAVGMHDENRAGEPGISEFLNLPDGVTDGSVVRNHALAPTVAQTDD